MIKGNQLALKSYRKIVDKYEERIINGNRNYGNCSGCTNGYQSRIRACREPTKLRDHLRHPGVLGFRLFMRKIIIAKGVRQMRAIELIKNAISFYAGGGEPGLHTESNECVYQGQKANQRCAIGCQLKHPRLLQRYLSEVRNCQTTSVEELVTNLVGRSGVQEKYEPLIEDVNALLPTDLDKEQRVDFLSRLQSAHDICARIAHRVDRGSFLSGFSEACLEICKEYGLVISDTQELRNLLIEKGIDFNEVPN